MKPKFQNVPVDKKLWARIKVIAKADRRSGTAMTNEVIRLGLPEFEKKLQQGA